VEGNPFHQPRQRLDGCRYAARARLFQFEVSCIKISE
jgi:hypothetical protein